MDIFETPTDFTGNYTSSDEELPTFDPTPEDNGVTPDASWLVSTDYFSGVWVDFAAQDARYDFDIDGDGILNSPGEFSIAYDADSDTAVSYAAVADAASQPGVVTGGSAGYGGIVISVSHGTNGHTYVAAGGGSPGFAAYSMATNDIDGLSTGWSGNYQWGTLHASVNTSAWAAGMGSYGTPGASYTFGIDVTSALSAIGDSIRALELNIPWD